MTVLERWHDQVLGTEKVAAFVWPSWWASAIQLVGGTFAMLGLGTRVATLPGRGRSRAARC